MLLPLVLLFIVVPIVEIYVIIQVGQAIGARELGGLDDLRAVVRQSCLPVTFEPKGGWDR